MQTTFEGGTFHAFVSYTSREAEVGEIQPLVDQYCHELWKWARDHGVDVFYDHFSLEPGLFDKTDLTQRLLKSIDRSHFFVAFLSPKYIQSEWCRLEWEQATRALRIDREPMNDPAIHPIYWKPDIQRTQTDLRTLDGRQWTDVTFAWHDRSRLAEAALKAAEDSAGLLRRKFSQAFRRRQPGSATTP